MSKNIEEYTLFEALKESLDEAIHHKEGKPNKCRVTRRTITTPDYKPEQIAKIRKDLNMTQLGLASAIGVSKRTVEAWETGRTHPSGTAQKLLYLFEQDNSLVNRLYE